MGRPTSPRRLVTVPQAGAVSGIVLLLYFMVFDRPDPLAVASVLAYYAIFACAYLVLGRPGGE